MNDEEKIRAARTEYMRRYRKTERGKAALARAQKNYWLRKFKSQQEGRKNNED